MPNSALLPTRAHWRNKYWRYQPAHTHNDSTAFRLRQQARREAALRSKETEAREAGIRG